MHMEKSFFTNPIYLYCTAQSQWIDTTLPEKKKKLALSRLKFYFLSQILRRQITAQDLIYGPHGKPFLKIEQNFSFNISYSEYYYAIAFAYRACHLGLDIEDVNRQIKLALAAYILGDKERAQWNLAHDKQRALLYYWVQKEAFIKIKGLSIFSGMKDMTFTQLTKRLYLADYDNQVYQIFHLTLAKQRMTLFTDDTQVKKIDIIDRLP